MLMWNPLISFTTHLHFTSTVISSSRSQRLVPPSFHRINMIQQCSTWSWPICSCLYQSAARCTHCWSLVLAFGRHQRCQSSWRWHPLWDHLRTLNQTEWQVKRRSWPGYLAAKRWTASEKAWTAKAKDIKVRMCFLMNHFKIHCNYINSTEDCASLII